MREWTGLYGGFSAGAAWSSAAHDSSTINTAVFYQSGSAIGGTLGYNWQVGRFIVGLEADAAAAKIEGQTVIFCPATCFSSVDAIASLRPRLGIALGDFMPYVTFGIATALLHASQAAASVSAWEPGWTAGAGLEFRFAQNWSLKLEYLRVRMNDAYYTATINNQPIFFDVNQHDVNMVRFGINFFPDWYAPKPAR